MKKILLIAALGLALVGCNGTTKSDNSIPERKGVTELFYFHGPQSCSSCITIENVTNGVLESYAEELESGKLIYSKLDLLEEEALAEKYEITWSSLLVVDFDEEGNEQIVDLTDKAYTYAMSDPSLLDKELRQVLNTLLNN